MKEKNIIGKKTTPFLLSKIAEKTKGKSLESNIQLVLNNASLAAQIARSFTEMS
jgi:pseudouridine-5'-phosphate glycosidase